MADNNLAYLKLITSEYANKPLYNSYVKAFLDMLSPLVDNYDAFDSLFNLDTAAGEQLDTLGSLVGISRKLPISNSNIDPILNDDTYRKVILSKIMANHWNGSIEGLEGILQKVFPDLSYSIVDNQDMSYNVVIIDPDYDEQVVELLFEGYILPKPSGIKVNYTIVDKALFGFDADTNVVKGWDLAEWSAM